MMCLSGERGEYKDFSPRGDSEWEGDKEKEIIKKRKNYINKFVIKKEDLE